MKKAKKFLVGLLACLCVGTFALGFTACEFFGIEFGEDKNSESKKTAYELWLEAGNTDTMEDFLNSLKGEQNNQGLQYLLNETKTEYGVIGVNDTEIIDVNIPSIYIWAYL